VVFRTLDKPFILLKSLPLEILALLLGPLGPLWKCFPLKRFQPTLNTLTPSKGEKKT